MPPVLEKQNLLHITELAEEFYKLLTFYVDEQLFAIPSDQVSEIMSIQKSTYLPHLPLYVKGVTNIRGKIVPLIDMRAKLEKEERAYDERTCMVITFVSDGMIGYIVDRVHDVIDVEKSQISDPPSLGEETERYLQGLVKTNDGLALLLDLEKMMNENNYLV